MTLEVGRRARDEAANAKVGLQGVALVHLVGPPAHHVELGVLRVLLGDRVDKGVDFVLHAHNLLAVALHVDLVLGLLGGKLLAQLRNFVLDMLVGLV